MTNCFGLNQRPASVRTVLVPKDLNASKKYDILQQQKMSEKLRDRHRERERETKKLNIKKRVSSVKLKILRKKNVQTQIMFHASFTSCS